MRLRMVVRIGMCLSVALFVLAIGYYTFVRLETTDRFRDANPYVLVPSDCVGVMEVENLNLFLNELPTLNYSAELEELCSHDLYRFLLDVWENYTSRQVHGWNNGMSRMLVSWHRSSDPHDQVVYLGMGTADEQLLADMLQEYAPTDFHPKREKYRDKELIIFPLGTDEYLVCYPEGDFLVLSLQKNLIERVVDACLDGTSLADDPVFVGMLQQKKPTHSLTLYGRTSAIPFLQSGEGGWSEYVLYMNSDVLYLTGDTYVPDSCDGSPRTLFADAPVYYGDSLFATTHQDSLQRYVDGACERDALERNLFEQGIANLSKDAVWSMVVDMQSVAEDPQRFAGYFPRFILDRSRLLQSFVVSAQYSWVGDRLSHFWVFTYQN